MMDGFVFLFSHYYLPYYSASLLSFFRQKPSLTLCKHTIPHVYFRNHLHTTTTRRTTTTQRRKVQKNNRQQSKFLHRRKGKDGNKRFYIHIYINKQLHVTITTYLYIRKAFVTYYLSILVRTHMYLISELQVATSLSLSLSTTTTTTTTTTKKKKKPKTKSTTEQSKNRYISKRMFTLYKQTNNLYIVNYTVYTYYLPYLIL